MSPPVSPSPIQAPQHVQDLLTKLHALSIDQESAISKNKQVISSTVIGDLKDKSPSSDPKAEFDNLMRDKFIALDEDKCHFVYQLVTAMGVTNVVEAGTSFGVSTIYLALAVAQNKARTGKSGVVIATENESEKAKVARGYWAQCGPDVERQIELREGNILDTLKENMPQVDLLLLDSE